MFWCQIFRRCGNIYECIYEVGELNSIKLTYVINAFVSIAVEAHGVR